MKLADPPMLILFARPQDLPTVIKLFRLREKERQQQAALAPLLVAVVATQAERATIEQALAEAQIIRAD